MSTEAGQELRMHLPRAIPTAADDAIIRAEPTTLRPSVGSTNGTSLSGDVARVGAPSSRNSGEFDPLPGEGPPKLVPFVGSTEAASE